MTVPNTPMLISASRKVVERKVLARSTDTEPDAAYGVDQGIGLFVVDLAANAPDIDVDDVGVGIEMQMPNLFQQHGPRHNVAFVTNQIFQHLEFPRQQLDL